MVNGTNRRVPMPGYTIGLFVEKVQVAELAGAEMTMLLVLNEPTLILLMWTDSLITPFWLVCLSATLPSV